MFSTTFLGHQGWVFRSAESCVLVDPLLREEFGHAHALDYRVYPPRALTFETFPAVDAVVLTHEHDDHFDIPSLARLDRKIPIYLSARSSSAAFRILSEMGFVVHPLVPGVSAKLGELELYPLVGDHTKSDSGDEWDALPFVVRDSQGQGSFFSAVDVTVTRGLFESARKWCARPGLIGWTNNTLDRSHMTSFLSECDDASPEFAEQMQAGQELLSRAWGVPRAMLLCAGGFSFYGSRAWLNQRVFCVDAQRVSGSMAAANPGVRYYSAVPGQTFHMQANELTEVADGASFLTTAPTETWPSRAKDTKSPAPDYEPATTRSEMTAQEVVLLRGKLQELADALAGSQLFRGLYSLMGVELAGYQCTFALVVRHGTRAAVFEYRPNACAFGTSRAERPRETYIAGMECWGSDLLAVLSGELSPIALSFGRAMLWNHVADRFDFNIFRELYRLSHPLRRPDAYHAIYQRLLSECADAAPVVHGHAS